MQEPKEQNRESSVIEIEPVVSTAGDVADGGILDSVGEVLGQAGEKIGEVLSELPVDVDIPL